MCEVDWEETYSVVLAACDHLAKDQPKEASMLMSSYLLEAQSNGASMACIYQTMISAAMRIVLDALDSEAADRLQDMVFALGLARAHG